MNVRQIATWSGGDKKAESFFELTMSGSIKFSISATLLRRKR